MLLVAGIAFFLVRSFIPAPANQAAQTTSTSAKTATTTNKQQNSAAKASAIITDTTKDFADYQKLSGQYMQDVASIIFDFENGTGKFTVMDQADQPFTMLAIHQHDDGSVVLNVKTASDFPNWPSAKKVRYLAFLMVPANVTLTKNFQTGKNLVDISETSTNRLAMGYSTDGKNYDLGYAYTCFTTDSRTSPIDDMVWSGVIYSAFPTQSAKVFGG